MDNAAVGSIETRELGVGLIGTGWVATAHATTFNQMEGTRVVAVTSRRKDRARAFASEQGLRDVGAYDDLARFLAHPGLDIVVVCTPHPNHPAETIAAAMAGKHVVIEKPVALARDDLHRMRAAVEQAGVKTSVCFELRWNGLFKNLKASIAAGLIGKPFYGEASYWHGCGPWYGQYAWNIKKDFAGSALLTAGCHALDGLIWLMDDRVVEVAAMANTSEGNPLKYEYDPNVVAILRFAGGAIGKVGTSLECRQPYHFPIVIQGEKGTLKDDRIASLSFPSLDGWGHLPAALPDSGDVSDHPYEGQMRHFVACIREDRTPDNDLAATSHVHEVMYAVETAIAERRTVEVQRAPRSS